MRGTRSVMPQRANVAFYYRNSYLLFPHGVGSANLNVPNGRNATNRSTVNYGRYISAIWRHSLPVRACLKYRNARFLTMIVLIFNDYRMGCASGKSWQSSKSLFVISKFTFFDHDFLLVFDHD